MEYNGLINLDNTYPQISNYISTRGNDALLSTGNAEVNLYGIYPDKNKLNFFLLKIIGAEVANSKAES